jgi:hypothetical protein
MLLEAIRNFRAALDEAPQNLDTQTRGEVLAAAQAAFEKAGQPYEYGIPGSDPNVEQRPDGALVLTLIYPIQSGTETIEAIRLRVPTLGDRKALPADEFEKTVERIKRIAVIDKTGRPLAPSEMDKVTEEDYLGLVGALGFLQVRFRQTGKTYKTS